MGNRIKLVDPGAAYIGRVSAVTLNKSGNWPDYEFHVENGDVVQVPQKAADRQLERLKLDADGTVGALIKFSRSEEAGANGKYFWNLDLAAPSEAKAAMPSKRVQPPTQGTPKSAHTAGPHIPGLDDDPYAPGGTSPIPAWHKVPPVAEEPRQTPREVAEQADAAEEGLSPQEVKRRGLERAYFDLWTRCAKFQSGIDETYRVPVDAASVNAMASTLFIEGNKRGLYA